MESTEKFLSVENLEAIKDTIQLELLKRGVIAPIVKLEEVIRKSNNHHIELATAEFQTIPVMFKKLGVINFGTFVGKKPKNELKPELEGEFISVWISVYFSYEHFNGGSNGVEMFNIWFNVFGSTSYDVKLNQIK